MIQDSELKSRMASIYSGYLRYLSHKTVLNKPLRSTVTNLDTKLVGLTDAGFLKQLSVLHAYLAVSSDPQTSKEQIEFYLKKDIIHGLAKKRGECGASQDTLRGSQEQARISSLEMKSRQLEEETNKVWSRFEQRNLQMVCQF
jgi:hypothetical protein